MESFVNRLNQYAANARELWNKLSLNQKVLIAGAAMLIITTVAILAISNDSTRKYEILYTDLTEKDAAAIVEKLDEDKINYKLSDNGATIAVPAEQKYKARLNLASQNLPRGEAGLELFLESSFGETQTDKKVKYQSALQGELARTIQSIDKVKAAKVNLALPEDTLFSEKEELPKASVVIRTQDGESLTNRDIQAIVHLVANTVNKLTPENVVVVDQNGNLLSDDISSTQANATETIRAQLAMKKQYEKEKETAIQSMLDKTLGPDNSVVRVNAELNFDNKEQVDEKYSHDPEGPFIRSEQVLKESSENTQNPNAQIPGTDNNIPQYPEVDGQGGGESTSSRNERTTNYELNRTETVTKFSPGEVKYDYLTVSVLVNNSAVANANLGQTDEERTGKIRSLVATACGLREDRNQENVRLEDNISIAFIDFFVEPVPEPINLSGIQGMLASPLTPWIMGVLGLIIVFLIFLLMRRRKQQEEELAAEALGFEAVVEEELNLEDLIDKALTPEEKELQKIKQEIDKLIDKNPEDAVQVIRIWLAEDAR